MFRLLINRSFIFWVESWREFLIPEFLEILTNKTNDVELQHAQRLVTVHHFVILLLLQCIQAPLTPFHIQQQHYQDEVLQSCSLVLDPRFLVVSGIHPGASLSLSCVCSIICIITISLETRHDH